LIDPFKHTLAAVFFVGNYTIYFSHISIRTAAPYSAAFNARKAVEGATNPATTLLWEIKPENKKPGHPFREAGSRLDPQ
jgi:hypothetical protein